MTKREIMLDDKHKDILSMEDLIKIFTYYNQFRKGCPQ